jgi:hypothetical protein
MGDGFNRAFVPWLYDRLATGRKLDAAAASYSITLLLGLAGLAYAVLVFWTFPLLVGPQYQGMRGIAMILIGGGVLQAASNNVAAAVSAAATRRHVFVVCMGDSWDAGAVIREWR